MHNREEIVKKAESWVGRNEKDGSFKEIIDLYNKGTRGYNVKYTDEWCATMIGALAIATGNTDIIPVECSCGRMIELAKKMGIWQEKDDYVPKIADIGMYDWNDSGKGDNTGWPDHVGIVTEAPTITWHQPSNNRIKVVEGNKSSAVGNRSISVNSKYIRGYITPKYDESSYEVPAETAPSFTGYKAKITAWSLYIRKGPDKHKYPAVGTYKMGNIVSITEEKNGWGRTDKGWISLNWTAKI
jgi:hypothetical protein